MTKMTQCSIQLMNKTYQIKCPAEEVDNLQLATQKLNECIVKNKKSGRSLSDFHTLLMAALHISHELLTCQNQHLQQRQQLTHFINSLESKINQVTELSR